MSGDAVALRFRPGLRLAQGIGGVACVSLAVLYANGAPGKRGVAIVWSVAAVVWLGRYLLMLLRPFLELSETSFTVRNPFPVTIERDSVESVDRRRGVLVIGSRTVARLKLRMDHLTPSDRETALAYFERLGRTAANRPDDGERVAPGS